ncbi:NUMOD3 domain-containing DNA-binding protein [Agrobacterium salinitolerans]|uniref:NUMOD3 domain-containing DNA-binding protein n=1 Tax=Agrobacterium salinitolerans TaxID=1183413 RepID=UPI000DD49DDA|nr:NUMOD3 domain-containing DNA-binding protein [Agrobacterium salinitolerans]MCZ7975024.1 NUMOD3 domain-containing DNA-binding protein [Agrobacterium salinitolerans]
MDDKERERRRKISEAKTGSKHSDETKAKIAQTLSGRRVSASARSNMRAAATGRKFSQTHKDAIAEGQRRRHAQNKSQNKP